MISQQPTKETVANIELFEGLAHGSAGLILPDKVKSVRYFTFSGHVYDFQTAHGLILANGIITHNCRSTLVSLTAGQAKSRSGKETGLNQPESDIPAADGWGKLPNTENIRKSLFDRFTEMLRGVPDFFRDKINKIFTRGAT